MISGGQTKSTEQLPLPLDHQRRVVERLLAHWERNPQLRLGQLVLLLGANHARKGYSYPQVVAWVPDDELVP